MIAEPNRNRSEHPEAFRPSDFFPTLETDDGDEPPAIDDHAIESTLAAIFRSTGVKVVDGESAR